MSAPGRRGAARPPRPSRHRWLASVLLAATLVAGCDVPFDPFAENTVGPFSVFGYLDVAADTQWIRVMPIRQDLLPDPAPIDAVVTLEHLGSGRVVTLRDSVFPFIDHQLGEVGYAHNFWTTEPIEPEATYRMTAARPDGAATTAVVEIPSFEMTLRFFPTDRPGAWAPRHLIVHAERLLYADLIYTVWNRDTDNRAAPVALRWPPQTTDPGRFGFALPGIGPLDVLRLPPFIDTFRRELRIAVAQSDWPFEHGQSLTDIAIPGNVPSTVEDGVGMLLGVGTWTIPLSLCIPIEARPDGEENCTTVFDASTASIAGRLTPDPCGTPLQLVTVRLTERYADGGAVVWEYKADWDGIYAFDGIEAGSSLLLEFGGHPDGAIRIPPLEPGERYVAPHVTMPSSC